jgi:Bacterial protein of unknown function (DUF899)
MKTQPTAGTAATSQVAVNHPVVSRDEWVAERKMLLAREKELTRLRDQVARERRALPWVRIDKHYILIHARAGAHSRSSSTAAVNCWCSTSCLPRGGSKAARAAPIWPITSTA